MVQPKPEPHHLLLSRGAYRGIFEFPRSNARVRVRGRAGASALLDQPTRACVLP